MAQLEMRKALLSADVLRKEVDHRVKNSLQSLSSFARLQHRAFKSPDARKALASMMTRIDTLAGLHEQLYTLDEHTEVSLGAYIRQVCDQLKGLAPPGVEIEVSASEVTVKVQQAVSVGAFLNEFAANSFKHAFPDERLGHVRVELRRLETAMIQLVCSDDGVGLPEHISKAQTGLGINIAEVICAELGCELDLQSRPGGVVASLVFKSLSEEA